MESGDQIPDAVERAVLVAAARDWLTDGHRLDDLLDAIARWSGDPADPLAVVSGWLWPDDASDALPGRVDGLADHPAEMYSDEWQAGWLRLHTAHPVDTIRHAALDDHRWGRSTMVQLIHDELGGGPIDVVSRERASEFTTPDLPAVTWDCWLEEDRAAVERAAVAFSALSWDELTRARSVPYETWEQLDWEQLRMIRHLAVVVPALGDLAEHTTTESDASAAFATGGEFEDIVRSPESLLGHLILKHHHDAAPASLEELWEVHREICRADPEHASHRIS